MFSSEPFQGLLMVKNINEKKTQKEMQNKNRNSGMHSRTRNRSTGSFLSVIFYPYKNRFMFGMYFFLC